MNWAGGRISESTTGCELFFRNLMAKVQAEGIKRVVVRGTNWVGDSLMTVPALRALRRVLPDANITLVIRPGAKGIFCGS